MDVPTLMHSLKEEVTCSVCMQLYTKPRQLPCLHIFCLRCLNNLARASAHNGKIKCPLCQSEVAVPETGTMETLPSCFYVKNLLDILAIKECNTSKVTCENCDMKSEEASYCFICGKFWCKDCLNGHNILRENREHRVLALKDFQDKDFVDVLKRPVFCQKELHDKEVLKYYCKVCDVPVCQACIIVEHNKHDVEHLEKAVRAVKNSIASKLDAAKESSNTLITNCIRELEENSRQLEHRSKINKEQIQQTVNSLILILRQKEQESIAEVENQTMKAQEQLRKNKDEFQDQLNKRERSISQIETLLQRSTAAELIRTKTIIDELFQGLQKPQDLPTITDRKSVTTVFFKNQELSQTLKESKIGHLGETVTEANQCSVEGSKAPTAGLETEIEVITRNSKGEKCYCPGDYITVELISAHDLNIVKEMKIVDKKNGSYTVSFIPSAAGQHLPIVQVNGEIIGDSSPVDIKERSFKPVRIIGEETIEGTNLKHPWGVTVNDSNEIFVSDMVNNRIVVFNEKGEFLRSFGQNVCLKCPNGLCIDNTGRLFVGNRDNNKILLFKANGEYITEIHDGESLRKPRGICLDAQRNLIVCDAGNNCVKFISPKGDIMKTIGRDRLHMPGTCLYYEDKIFVSDFDAHVIRVFQSDGRFLYEFGRHGIGDGDLNRPAGLAVDKSDHLLVCSWGNHIVQVFTLDGKFVTKFGEYGKELGQMDNPSSVSVQKSGHIVICDLGNRRLQVFE